MNNLGAVQVIVTTVLLTLEDGELRVILTLNEDNTNIGQPALFNENVRGDEDPDLDSIVRGSLKRRAAISDIYIEQLETFSVVDTAISQAPTIQVSYVALASESTILPAIERFQNLQTFSIDRVPALSRNGEKVVAAAASRLRGKGAWSIMPAYLLDREFTIAQLNAVYDAVVGTTSFGANFRQKILRAGVLVPAGSRHTDGATKKSEHYSICPGAFETGIRL